MSKEDEIGRDNRGRFVKGLTGLQRTARAIKRHEFKEQLLYIVNEADWYEIVVRAINDAKRGNWRAREWLSDHLIGKPVQGLDITTKGQSLIRPDLALLTEEELLTLERIYKRSDVGEIAEFAGDPGGEGEA